MVLEAVMICVDNSGFMRNGDYIPTRLDAQTEAVNYLASMKTQSNPESTVGLLASAGKRVEVLLSLDRSLGKMMNALHDLRPGGTADITSALKTAQLVLKNRQNKSQKQRIILFVGSPVLHETKAIVRVAKNLKKNNVAVDIVNFGSENSTNDNQEKLEAFIAAVNSGDNSKLVNVPPGPHNLSDMIVSSIMSEAGGAMGNVGGGGGGQVGQFGDVDAQNDPELALALRMSMEEERDRQQREANRAGGDAANQNESGENQAEAAQEQQDQEMVDDGDQDDEEDEDALLAEAIALSMDAEQQDGDADMDDSADKDDSDKPKSEEEMQLDAALTDVDFLEGLIDSLPGVNKSEIDIQELLDSVNNEEAENSKDSEKDKDKDSDKS